MPLSPAHYTFGQMVCGFVQVHFPSVGTKSCTNFHQSAQKVSFYLQSTVSKYWFSIYIKCIYMAYAVGGTGCIVKGIGASENWYPMIT